MTWTTTVSLNDEKKRIKTSAGWSSPGARQAHNLKVVGSNPTPATKYSKQYQCTNGHPRVAISICTRRMEADWKHDMRDNDCGETAT